MILNGYLGNRLKSIRSAGQRIAKEIKFQKPIRVLVDIDYFEMHNLLVQTQPDPNYIATIQEGNHRQEVTLPQALAKQRSILDDNVANGADFKIYINGNQNWNLHPHSDSIYQDYLDLEMLVAHELTHGLGFMSGLSEIESSAWLKMNYFSVDIIT